MIAVPAPLPDDPILLKHLLLLASEQAAAKDARIEQLQEQVALLRHKLFSPKSERSPEDADSPQLAMFNVTAPQTTPSSEVKAHRCCAPDFPGAQPMMRPDPKVKAVYLYPKPVDFRKSINGLAALVELDIKVAVFDPALFVFLNRTRNQVKILYWHRNGFCLWLKRLEAERFKTKPDAGDEAIELTVRELNQLLEGIDLWGNQPHKVLTPRFVT